jgi:aminomuconate-semialdehyde/2-hydroxymuconate-6-semialdehyde dehydrogenase
MDRGLKATHNFIGGEFVAAKSGKTFETARRSTAADRPRLRGGRAGGRCGGARRARRAHRSVGSLDTAKRSELLYAVADEITRRFDDFLEAEVADTGKPLSLAKHLDIPRGAANFKIFADVVKNVPTESFQMATPDGKGALNYAIRVPKGVVAVICPWNLPLLLMTWKVGPALACGNTVVVKPSEETPSTATLLGEVMNKVGVPPGVYNVVHGFGPGSAGEFLACHEGVDAITFTGETRTGTAIMKTAAEGTRAVSFELGGKNAGLVFADCDFDAAVDGIARAAFANCGQVCLGTERVYVERPIFERFVQTLKKKPRACSPAARGRGDRHRASDQPGAPRKVLSYYKKAVEDGATVVTGGGIPDMPAEIKNGAWIQPTIWTGLAEDSAVIREEIFGPCCHIRPFDAEDEAIRLANDTPYGLATTIWTTNLTRAHRVSAQIDVGICWVNCWFLRDLRTPFGGSKESGIGREGGVHSLEFYTELRNVCVKL